MTALPHKVAVIGAGEIGCGWAALCASAGWPVTVFDASARTLELPVSFLPDGEYQALVVRDQPHEPAAVRVETVVVSPPSPVKIELAGFRTYTTRVTLATGDRARVDVQMQVGEVTESVQVTADADILPIGNTVLGTHMPSRVVNDLPLNIDGGRSLEGFAYAVTPAVEGNSWTSYIGGSAAFSKEIMVDGTSTVIQYGGTIATAPPMEAVEEFKVETSGFRAENARTGGGVFQFTSWAPGSSGKADSLVRPFKDGLLLKRTNDKFAWQRGGRG